MTLSLIMCSAVGHSQELSGRAAVVRAHQGGRRDRVRRVDIDALEEDSDKKQPGGALVGQMAQWVKMHKITTGTTSWSVCR